MRRGLRLLAAVLVAAVLAGSAIRLRASDGYNDFPAYCHSHDASFIMWWVYSCWLPDPPGEPML